ncbi:MAG: DUF4238 domain-containing protein [Aurantimonas endophytica]|uniref:DUF4238 domain-containing protein n=1 Tax=Aurantimonas endophytica TaxID=1522175 RepID=UPI00300109DB
MSEARNHHYVPQSYLRGFADGIRRKARVVAYDLQDLTSFKTLVRNVAAQRDFNRLEDVEGLEPNALEERYAILEGHAAVAVQNIVKSETFAGDDRMYLLNLMALLVIRNPRMRDNWSDFVSRLYKMTAEVAFSKKEIWEATKRDMEAKGYKPMNETSYEELRDFVKGGEYDIVTNRLMHIRLELETWEKIIHLLSARKWRLCILPDQVPDLITCDHPVSLISLVERPDTLLGNALGYGMADTAVVFPLTRRASLWGTFEGQDETKSIGWLQAALNNSHAMRNAERQIYAYNENFQFMWGRQPQRGGQLLTLLRQATAERDRQEGKK